MNNLDSIVNQILAESFETGETNVMDAGATPEKRGGIERQMLAGSLVDSPAYFFQPPIDATHQPLNALLSQQAQQGLGELVGIGGAVNDFVEAYLEDTAVEMYTNPNNIDYLINSLKEHGLSEYASAVDAITMNPTLDDVAKLNEMIKELEKNPKNEYFVESLVYIAEQIVEADEAPGTEDGSEDDDDDDDTSGIADTASGGDTV